eukprot:TRINITY_DN10623_c0_g1_i14.p1 TRINITY_DN10623_c0_g1~~TRINITY_DN10623_c0_g1_i14.p1  ORF type:complete len:334 (+),score=102.58 TRINITY_DN10623_c0_g1_i14:150-1151(+)
MEVPVKPKYYHNVCESVPNSCFSYDNLTIPWGSLDYYEVASKVGMGRYSEVYEALNTANNRSCVVKILKVEKNYKREIFILQTLFDGPNIIRLYDVIKDHAINTPSLVFESINGEELEKVKQSLTDDEVRHYLYELLRALDYSNSKGVMHRDIKPENIVVNRETTSVRLIDWGLAEFYLPHKDYSLSVSTLNYKAPELLINDTHYHYSLDVWSLGCVFAEMLFRRGIFLDGSSKPGQLMAMVRVLGSEGLAEVIAKYKLKPGQEFMCRFKNFPKIPFTQFINKKNEELVNDCALDLLEKMLTYDKNKRITPKDAMQHPYFDSVVKDTEFTCDN